MELFAPEYYKDFKCIAERCKHSCCIGWEIDVDDEVLEKHKAIETPLGHEMLEKAASGAICLDNYGRCPFLTASGLCRIISALGDGYVSKICREHPRFYHAIGDRAEVGIGAVCEEAARIILSADNFDSFIAVGEVDGDTVPDVGEESVLHHRDRIYEILKSHTLTYNEKVSRLLSEYSIDKQVLESDQLLEALSEIELLYDTDAELFSLEYIPSDGKIDKYLERFAAYLVFRHASVAQSYDNLRARVVFSLLLTLVLESAAMRSSAFDLDGVADIARRISEEIEYSEDNTSALIFEIECII